MKTMVKIPILLFALLFSISLQAQDKKNIIKTSLVFPVAQIIEISYERVLDTEKSLQLSVLAGGDMEIGLIPEFRFYLSDDQIAPSGIFIAPFAMVSGSIGGGGIMVGIQRLFKSKITIDADLGPFVTGHGVAVWGGINMGLSF